MEPSNSLLGCRSDGERARDEWTLRVDGAITEGWASTTLAASDTDRKRELIAKVNAGEHVELVVSARTFRQRDGSPNRNHLRFKPSKLGVIASSFAGMPVLLDHAQRDQRARIGTIERSEAVEQGHGWTAFLMDLRIVKPHAVVSVLDGTLDQWSIGWDPAGPVHCSVHEVDIRGPKACGCWPGDTVLVDDTKRTVEFEWQATQGVECSGVNVAAVQGTRNIDVRAALALELNLSPPKGIAMSFTRLAGALSLAALTAPEDEDRAVRAVEDLKRGKLAAEQERDAALAAKATTDAKLASLEKLAADAAAAALATQVDAAIAGAYTAGKLRWNRDADGKAIPSPKETRLRRIAKEDGMAGLNAELADMEIVVPLGQRQLTDDSPRERGPSGGALKTVADQLGFDHDELSAYADNLYSQEG